MRVLCPVAFLVLLQACAGHEGASDGAPRMKAPADKPPSVNTIPEEDPPELPPAVEVSLSAIGVSRAPNISGKARAKNRAALKLHRAGDYAASRVGFEETLELSSDHDMARFNLACALSRLGELEAARGQLQTTLYRDLLRFQGRWRGPDADPDLEPLRTSEHAVEVDALVGALRDAYDTAHDRGVAGYLYDRPPTPAETDYAGTAVSKGSSTLIAGAWLHEAGRFVPLARGGTVALLDLPNRRLLRADVSRDERHCHWDVFASEELASTAPEPGVKPPGDAYDRAVEETVEDWEPAPSPGLSFEGEPAPAVATWIDVRPYGGVFRAPVPDGYLLSRKRLTVPGRDEPFKLDRTYEAVFATADPDAPLILLSRRAEVDSDGEQEFSSVVSRLDLSSGVVERIARGPGNAWVTLGPDDAVYVEVRGEVRRWPTADADTAEATMVGLHITMPFGGPSCMCCG